MDDHESDLFSASRRFVRPDRQPVSPYANPQLASFLDSFEGETELPEPAAERPPPDEAGSPLVTLRDNAYHFLEWAGVAVPGLVLAALLAMLGRELTDWIFIGIFGYVRSPLSAISVAVLLGLLVSNTIGIPESYRKGLGVALKLVLRFGIALLGIRLSLLAAAEISLISIPVVLSCIAAALLLVTHINRLFGLPHRLGCLIAVGTAICGNSAIVATAPGIDAEDDEVSYAVACITIFGLVTMFIYPFLAHFLFSGDPSEVGLFLGTAVHDTAQVTGAGLMYLQLYDAPVALDTAVVSKLVRNLCMVWVIPLMAILYHRSRTRGVAEKTPKWFELVPFFVIGFVLMTLFRTVGDIGDRPFGFLEPAAWDGFVASLSRFATWCLMIAMAAVGLGTSFRKLKSLGWKPFTVGFVAAALVGCVSFAMIKLVGMVL